MPKESPKLNSRQLAEAAAQMADPVPLITDGELKGEAIVEVYAPRPVPGLAPGAPVAPVAGLVPAKGPGLMPSKTPPPSRAISRRGEFIVLIRSDRGTLHAALDEKRLGAGALATYDTAELAKSAADGHEVCQKLKYYILGVV